MAQSSDNIRVERLVTVPMSPSLQAVVVDVQPPAGASMLEAPGPKRTPARPYLDLGTSPAGAGVAARVMQADGEVMPRLVLAHEGEFSVVTLPAAPLGARWRSDGAWVLYRDRLVHISATGEEVRSVNVAGSFLFGGADDGVWLAGLDEAWRVSGEGAVRGPYPWKGARASVGSGAALCALDRRAPHALRCLAPDGDETEAALAAPPQPLEALLWVDPAQGRAVTRQGSTLRWYGPSGVEAAHNLQSAGVTEDGRGFVSMRTEAAVQVAIEPSQARALAVPDDAPAAMGAVAVAGDTTVVYGRDRAYTFEGDHQTRSDRVDDDYFRATLFPTMWRLAATGAVVAGLDGRLLVSATGPGGMVIVAMRGAAP